MSYSKRAWEDENDKGDPFARCGRCGEFVDDCICPDVATEGRVFEPGEEGALTQAVDSFITRTPPHPLDGEEDDDDSAFARWAGETVRAEMSRGMLDGMWERIKIKLDDLKKVEELLGSVFGSGARMVEKR